MVKKPTKPGKKVQVKDLDTKKNPKGGRSGGSKHSDWIIIES